MRTAAQEQRVAPRPEAEMRERAAPFVIVLDIRALLFSALRRGTLIANGARWCEGELCTRWTTHCGTTCGLHGTNQLRLDRGQYLIEKQSNIFAKNFFVPEQSAAADAHKIATFGICGASQGGDDAGRISGPMTLACDELLLALLLVGCSLLALQRSSY